MFYNVQNQSYEFDPLTCVCCSNANAAKQQKKQKTEKTKTAIIPIKKLKKKISNCFSVQSYFVYRLFLE